MLLQTLGHATLALRTDESSEPLLITDPWIRGSCYWRSWWLQRYPSAAQVATLGRAKYCYLTHEHPDHFHPPSLRALGTAPTYLTPEFNRDQMGDYLGQHGFRARALHAGRFEDLGDGVRVMSLPTVGNDSMLLIDAPTAFIANLNDARPDPAQLLLLRSIRRRVGKGKPSLLLASYSAAGLSNSLYRGGTRVPYLEENWHSRYVGMLCRSLEADVYLPFASQVTFERPDTRWAADFQVPVQRVREHLASIGTRTCPPFVTYNLSTGAWVTEEEQPPHREANIEGRVQAQIAQERTELDGDDLLRLEQKLRSAGRALLPWMFPRGIAFDFGGQKVVYDCLRGHVRASDDSGSVRLRLPAQAVHDVLHSGYFSDICIPMFTHVDLGPEVPAAHIFIFFTLMQLHDVGATASLHGFRRWLRVMARSQWLSLRAS